MISYALALLCGVLLLCADQLTKYYISANFALGESHEFLKGFIDLTYIHNRGGAWGMLYGRTYILLPVTLAIMALCIVFYVKYGKKNRLLLWAISLVMSGRALSISRCSLYLAETAALKADISILSLS